MTAVTQFTHHGVQLRACSCQCALGLSRPSWAARHLLLTSLRPARPACPVHQLAGMIFVPPGYSFGADMFSLEAVKAGSPWGAATFAGADGSRQPTEVELQYAKHQASVGALAAGALWQAGAAARRPAAGLQACWQGSRDPPRPCCPRLAPRAVPAASAPAGRLLCQGCQEAGGGHVSMLLRQAARCNRAVLAHRASTARLVMAAD